MGSMGYAIWGKSAAKSFRSQTNKKAKITKVQNTKKDHQRSLILKIDQNMQYLVCNNCQIKAHFGAYDQIWKCCLFDD